MTVRQSFTVGLLAAVILWWALDVVDQAVASVVLLAGFALFSGVPPRMIFAFPLSENFVLIAVSFLFSQGILNSGLAGRLLEPLLGRFANTAPRLLTAMILCSFVTALFIPQSISRTMVVAALFSGYLERSPTPGPTRSVLLFGLFFTGILVGLLFPRGDIVLNYSLLSLAGMELSDLQWIVCLAPPTLCVLVCASLLYLLIFRKELRDYRMAWPSEGAAPLRRRERWDLTLVAATVLMWTTEPLHGVSGTAVVLLGTLLMFPSGLLTWRDLRAIDLRVLTFLTAAFSIGGVVTASGLDGLLFHHMGALLPAAFSWRYALAVLLCAMGMHMLLGSNVTSLAVAIPILMSVSAQRAPDLVVSLLIYVAVSQHFLLPFHHVTLALGVGKHYFSSGQVLRFGLPMTLLVLAGGIVFYLNWWRLLGMLTD